ncbi:MAG: hypothetical protein R6T98_07090 [Desulfatiglandales bacterium]
MNTLKGPGSTGRGGVKRGRHLLTLCPLILSVFLDRIYPSGIIFEFHGAGRINWMFFLFSLSGRKGEREPAFGGGCVTFDILIYNARTEIVELF